MIRPPQDAVDTHVHVFDPARFPFAADAAYHPVPAEVGPAEDLEAVLERLGPRSRGIARVPLDCSGRALDALGRRGVAGIRIDFMGPGHAAMDDPATSKLLARLADRGMVCVMQAEGARDMRCLAVAL